MNRLQKKCVIATAGFHLLLLVILFVGPAFFNEQPKVDNSPVLDVIPDILIDAALNSGVKNATPPPPTPPVAPPQSPTPPVPQVVTPPTPAPVPDKVVPVKRIKPDLTPVAKPDVVTPPPSRLNMTPVVRSVPKNPVPPVKAPDNSKGINSAVRALRNSLSHPTEIAPVGNSSMAAANYGAVVVSVYYQTWPAVTPSGMDNDNAMVKFTVTIARDGTVINSRIVKKSGEGNVDAAVQRMLERVTSIAPFPEGATENQRTYTIDFNANRTIE